LAWRRLAGCLLWRGRRLALWDRRSRGRRVAGIEPGLDGFGATRRPLVEGDDGSQGGRQTIRLERLAQYALATAGTLALGFYLANVLESKFYQKTEARNFDKERRIREGSKGTSLGPIAPTVIPRNGDVVGKLEIPRLNVSVMVVEGADTSNLKHAVGHITGTVLPGELGNVGIAGHRDTSFRPLRLVQPNDTIALLTLRGAYQYRVVSTNVIQPRDVHVLDSAGSDTLTLVTCYPFYYVGPAPERFIVRAERLLGDGF